MKRDKTYVVSGKFRLIHQKHKELILRTTLLEDIKNLKIVITHDDNLMKRHATISETIVAMSEITRDIDGVDIEIKVSPYFTSNLDFEKWIADSFGTENIVMVDGKESYENNLFPSINIYSKDEINEDISVTEIEKAPLKASNYALIAREFRPYINKRIVISGVESTGKTQLCTRLGLLYNTKTSPEVGRFYADKHLGGNDNAFMPKDFAFIVDEQMEQDRRINKDANQFLFVDTDPFVTLRFLRSYKEEYISKGLMSKAFEDEFSRAEKAIETKCSIYKNDLTFVMAPTVKYVKDGTRWNDQKQEEREARHQELLDIYSEFNVEVIIVSAPSYKERFDEVNSKILESMDIRGEHNGS